MKTRNHLASIGLLLVGLGWLAPRVWTQAPPPPPLGAPSLLKIEVKNQTLYVFDSAPSQLASTAAAQTYGPSKLPLKSFATEVGIGDITTINDAPMAGTVFASITLIPCERPFKPNQHTVTRGHAIADADNRNGLFQWTYDIYTLDLDPATRKELYIELGTVLMIGLGKGERPPGAPALIDHAAYVVVGGTGVFAGVHGYYANTPDKVKPPRITSAREDPAYRRHNVGGVLHTVLYLYPDTANPPQVVVAANEPQVFHKLDDQPVTQMHPATPGETLYAMVTGLGPLRTVDPAQPKQVLAPVAVAVNGQPQEVDPRAATEWPTMISSSFLQPKAQKCRVEFQLPKPLPLSPLPVPAPVSAAIRISMAWMWGPEVSIPIQ